MKKRIIAFVSFLILEVSMMFAYPNFVKVKIDAGVLNWLSFEQRFKIDSFEETFVFYGDSCELSAKAFNGSDFVLSELNSMLILVFKSGCCSKVSLASLNSRIASSTSNLLKVSMTIRFKEQFDIFKRGPNYAIDVFEVTTEELNDDVDYSSEIDVINAVPHNIFTDVLCFKD